MTVGLFNNSEIHPFTVSEITVKIKSTLEENFPRLYVIGEISNFKRHTASGHGYFSLKDEKAALSAVIWKSRLNNLIFTPQDGIKVLAIGRITVYPPRGNYQLDVYDIQPAGIGELQIAFEKLKEKLSQEGLFDPKRKRPLPKIPNRIGIVTSETGAAFKDIISVIKRRFPSVEIILFPVKVQGAGAADEISEAIRRFNRIKGVDVMIVGRGGGSMEDLWAFNEEIVARAIFESEIPVVSAVGHEIDLSIADLVADVRAPTPSAAAELIVPDRRELLEIISDFKYTLSRSIRLILKERKETIHRLINTYSFNRPYDMLRDYSQRVDEFERQLHRILKHLIDKSKYNAESLNYRLQALNPNNVVNRGYAIVYDLKGEILQTRRETVEAVKGIIKFKDGKVRFTADIK